MISPTKRNELIQTLNNACQTLSLTLSLLQQEQLIAYIEMLLKWQKAFNLTGFTDPLEILQRLIIESLAIIPYLHGNCILDVGTGGGIPGIPLAIALPEKTFYLLDARRKRIVFLTQLCLQLKLTQVKLVNERIEDYSPSINFDTIVTRAFSALDNFIGLISHLCDENTQILALKGEKARQEIQALPDGFIMEASHSISLPGQQTILVSIRNTRR